IDRVLLLQRRDERRVQRAAERRKLAAGVAVRSLDPRIVPAQSACLDDRQQRCEAVAARHLLGAADDVQELAREDEVAPRRAPGRTRAWAVYELDEPAAAFRAHESARVARELLCALGLEAGPAIREQARRRVGVTIRFRSGVLPFHAAVL